MNDLGDAGKDVLALNNGKSLLGGLLADMEATAVHAGGSPAATVEVDAPSWALREGSARDSGTHLVGWMLLLAGLMVGLALLFLLAVENSHSDHTIMAILAVAVAVDVTLVALLGRSAIPRRTPESILRLRIGAPRVAGGTAGSAQQTVAGDKAATSATNGASTAPESQPSAETTPAESASGLAALLGKEPVLVQTAVLVAGVLAVAFSTNLGGTEVGGIAAGAAAALGLLTRATTTSVAAPKNAAGEKLIPSKEASNTAS